MEPVTVGWFSYMLWLHCFGGSLGEPVTKRSQKHWTDGVNGGRSGHRPHRFGSEKRRDSGRCKSPARYARSSNATFADPVVPQLTAVVRGVPVPVALFATPVYWFHVAASRDKQRCVFYRPRSGEDCCSVRMAQMRSESAALTVHALPNRAWRISASRLMSGRHHATKKNAEDCVLKANLEDPSLHSHWWSRLTEWMIFWIHIAPDSPQFQTLIWCPEDANVTRPLFDNREFSWGTRLHAPKIVTGLAGSMVCSAGIVANQPELSGRLCWTSTWSRKAADLWRLLRDAFNIPILALVDVPGFLPYCLRRNSTGSCMWR